MRGGAFRHRFNLVVPGLNNYTYELFTVQHEIEPYPITVPRGEEFQELYTEEAFVAWLKEELSSRETGRILANLLAQVTS